MISDSHITRLNNINEGDSNGKLSKTFAGKKLANDIKNLTGWFNPKNVLKIDACGPLNIKSFFIIALHYQGRTKAYLESCKTSMMERSLRK